MFIPNVKFGVSSGKIAVFHNVVIQSYRHANCSVVVVNVNISAYILSQLQKNRRDSGCISIFNNNVLAAVCVSLYVCANHFTSDCFSNEGQYKAGFASTLTLIKGSVPTIRDPATAPEPQVSVAAV